ncbi:MAG: hypothetical protein ABSB76_11190 [Streptosporangiaceae bacterium]
MTGTEARLARVRGQALPRSHNARTIAALASNPGCARRAILDAAGVDKQRLAAHYDDLGEVGGRASPDMRHARTRRLLARAASANSAEGTMFDHPLLRLEAGGRHAFLEPDLIAFQLHGKFHVLEIKSFAVVDGQADGAKVAAAAIQSAVYILALRAALAEQDISPEAVSDEAILVCPENFPTGPSRPHSTCAGSSPSCAASWPASRASTTFCTCCRPA